MASRLLMLATKEHLSRRLLTSLSLCQCCCRLLCHPRVAVIEVQTQHLPPHGLVTRGLHSHNSDQGSAVLGNLHHAMLPGRHP